MPCPQACPTPEPPAKKKGSRPWPRRNALWRDAPPACKRGQKEEYRPAARKEARPRRGRKFASRPYLLLQRLDVAHLLFEQNPCERRPGPLRKGPGTSSATYPPGQLCIEIGSNFNVSRLDPLRRRSFSRRRTCVRIRAKTTSSTTAEDCNCVRGRRNRSTRNSHCSVACGKSWFRKDWREGRGKRATCPGFHENREYVHWCGENRSARESGTEKQAGRQRGRAIPVPVRRMRSGDAAFLPVAGRKKKWKRREELEKRWRS